MLELFELLKLYNLIILIHSIPVYFTERKTAPSFVRKLKNMEVTLGLPITFECCTTGSAPIETSWFKDGIKLLPGENLNISFMENVASLQILKTELDHAGEYSCKASNIIGDASCSSRLILKGKMG